MSACPYCHDTLGHPGLAECPESGGVLPTSRPEPDQTAVEVPGSGSRCPHCRAAGGHPGLENCPDTGGRMPVERVVAQTEPERGTDREADAAPAPTASEPPGNRPATGGDPFAMYDKVWQLEIRGREIIGLDNGESVVLGRDPASPIGSWCDDNISRRHVEITGDGDGLVANDLGSTNGTFLNGTPLEVGTPARCKDGDVLQLATENPIRVEIRGG